MRGQNWRATCPQVNLFLRLEFPKSLVNPIKRMHRLPVTSAYHKSVWKKYSEETRDTRVKFGRGAQRPPTPTGRVYVRAWNVSQDVGTSEKPRTVRTAGETKKVCQVCSRQGEQARQMQTWNVEFSSTPNVYCIYGYVYMRMCVCVLVGDWCAIVQREDDER